MVGMWLPPDILDLTAKSPPGYRVKNRDSARIDAAVLHQTGFDRGNTPENYKDVHAHFVVMPNGCIVQLHPVAAWLVASSAFNDDAISIEFVGNFASDRGTYWRPETYGRSVLSQAQVGSGRDLLRLLQDKHGIGFVFAHRQGELASARGNCPGPDVWYNIGEWAVRGLGLSDGGHGHKEGQGSAIPDSWRQPR